ncbi:hypothetical protein PhCBS80983_g04422 [Powellomyces hirtus]|uniref:B30.2/SPRY domain-containing protein n=1 Tax=Powellomyces hirtus TaxID=109895 RepID=A0A507DYS2_9FUNG|nr:hypothetical protein PhCBS80983_g04422 [Powellomyces hirtus]
MNITDLLSTDHQSVHSARLGDISTTGDQRFLSGNSPLRGKPSQAVSPLQRGQQCSLTKGIPPAGSVLSQYTQDSEIPTAPTLSGFRRYSNDLASDPYVYPEIRKQEETKQWDLAPPQSGDDERSTHKAGSRPLHESPTESTGDVKPPAQKKPGRRTKSPPEQRPCYCDKSPEDEVDVIHITLLNLSLTVPPRKLSADGKHKYYGWKPDICHFIDLNWKRFWLKTRTATWENTVASCLSTQKRFLAGMKQFGHDQGLWALEAIMLPSAYEHGKRATQPESNIAADGTLQRPERPKAKRKRADESENDSVAAAEIKTKRPRGKTRSHSNTPQAESAKSRASKQAKKKPVEEEFIDPAIAIELYRDVDNATDPVQMSHDTTHRAPQVTVADDGMTVSSDAGYRMAKATHGVWEGKWYYEVMINQHSGHTRIGWSQISGDLQAPCGYDQFSYGYRDSPGTLFHQSVKNKEAPPDYSEGYGPGDIMGMAISLPSTGSIADLFPRLWDKETPYLPFRSKPLTVATESEIQYYRNGARLGVAYKNLLRGKYHPAISLYRGANVTVNFGPNFRCPPPAGYRPMSEATELPLWKDLEDTVWEAEVLGADHHPAATTAEHHDHNATPGPSSSVDGEGEDENIFSDEEDVGSGSATKDVSQEMANDVAVIIKMDPDEALGVQALLNLGGLYNTADTAPTHTDGTGMNASPKAEVPVNLAMEIDKKEAEVVELIRRSSIVDTRVPGTHTTALEQPSVGRDHIAALGDVPEAPAPMRTTNSIGNRSAGPLCAVGLVAKDTINEIMTMEVASRPLQSTSRGDVHHLLVETHAIEDGDARSALIMMDVDGSPAPVRAVDASLHMGAVNHVADDDAMIHPVHDAATTQTEAQLSLAPMEGEIPSENHATIPVAADVPEMSDTHPSLIDGADAAPKYT